MEFSEISRIEKVIDELENGKANLRVHLVVPPSGDNPWRTLAHYEQEQKEARERHSQLQSQHQMLTEQHQKLLATFRWNKYAVIAAGLSALAALWTAYYTTTKMDTMHTHKETQQSEQPKENLKIQKADGPKKNN